MPEQQVEPGDSVQTTQDIVGFTNDAGLRMATLPSLSEVNLAKDSSINSDLSIISFLQRPKLYRPGSFATGDVYGTIGGVPFPPQPVLGSFLATTLAVKKLEGVLGIRAKTVVRIVINATRFAQGRYGLYWVPTGGANEQAASSRITRYIADYRQRSQLPHVEFDLNCDTEAILEIPYVSAYNYYTLTNISSADVWRLGEVGYFFVAPVHSATALKPATEKANYSLYWHLEDVSLITASNVPQSAISIAESKSKGAGPIETTARNISKASGILTRVPLISTFASNLKWASDITAGVASIFGLSRPSNEGNYQRVKRKPFGYLTNVDELDNSDPLSLSVKHSVQKVSGFAGTSIDELDLQHFVSRKSIYRVDTISSTTATGVTVYDLPISPLQMGSDGLDATVSPTCFFTPMGLVASQFLRWRGSIAVNLKFVKSEFHSGRLEVRFIPHSPNTGWINTAANDFVYKEIIDLRYKNEITLILPYVSPMPYTSVQFKRDGSPSQLTGGEQRIFSTGRFHISVLDPIVAPPNVEQSITMITSTYGGKDLEFAGPIFNEWSPVSDVTPQSGIDCGMNEVIMGGFDVSNNLDSSTMCAGERILSLRTLLKKFVPSPTYGTDTGVYSSYFIRPKTIGWITKTVVITTLHQKADLYTLIGSCFALSRGGVRIKYVNPSPNGDRRVGVAVLVEDDRVSRGPWFSPSPIDSLFSPTQSAICYNTVVFNPAQEFGTELLVPAYQSTHSLPTLELISGPFPDFAPVVGNGFNAQYAVSVRDDSVTSYNFAEDNSRRPFVCRAFAEDSDFGLFISIPLMRKSLTAPAPP